MATTVEGLGGRPATEAGFRICPVTGLRVHIAAQTLIKANAVAAVIFLAIGGLFGLLVALTRWPAVHLLDAEWFYLILTAHGLDVLLVWIIFFEVAVLYFASAILLGSRLATPRLAWVAFALMLIGAAVTNVAVLQGDSSVMFTSYPPMQAAPNFYLGLILFAVGALTAVFIFFGTLVIAKEEGTYEGSIPLVTFGALTAAIIAVFTLASGAVILIPTWLWSLGLISSHRPADVQAGLVGHGPFLPADQRLGPRRGMVPDHRRRARRQAAVREDQPQRLPALHPVPAARQRAPPAGRARDQLRVEGVQHQLRHVSRGARQHDPRHDRARRDRGGAAPERASPTASSSGCERRPGTIRRSPGCSSRW